MIRSQSKEIEYIYPHLGHSIRALRRKISQCKSTWEVGQLLNPYGITHLIFPPFEGSIVNGFIKVSAKGNLALIVGSREKDGDSLISALRHLLGHIINGHISGTFIDFKTTKIPADKKADRW